MKRQPASIKGFIAFRPLLEDALELASTLVADGLKGRALPKSRREAIEHMARFGNGETGDTALTPLAEQALGIWGASRADSQTPETRQWGSAGRSVRSSGSHATGL